MCKHTDKILWSRYTLCGFSCVFSLFCSFHTHSDTHSAKCVCLWLCGLGAYIILYNLNVLNSAEQMGSLNPTAGLRSYICHDERVTRLPLKCLRHLKVDLRRLFYTEEHTHRDNLSPVCKFCCTSVTEIQKWGRELRGIHSFCFQTQNSRSSSFLTPFFPPHFTHKLNTFNRC